MNIDKLTSTRAFLLPIARAKNVPGTGQSVKPHELAPLSFGALLNRAAKRSGGMPGNGAGPNLLENVMAAADPKKIENAQVALQSLNSPQAGPSVAEERNNPMVALEGTLMTKFVDEMLPKSKDGFYGSGLAGDTWRGFEVDQFGSALASSDPLNFTSNRSTIKLTANSGVDSLLGKNTFGQFSNNRITPFSG